MVDFFGLRSFEQGQPAWSATSNAWNDWRRAAQAFSRRRTHDPDDPRYRIPDDVPCATISMASARVRYGPDTHRNRRHSRVTGLSGDRIHSMNPDGSDIKTVVDLPGRVN